MTPARPALPLLALVLAAAGASPDRWRADEALAADRLELQVDEHGRAVEYEYHIAPDAVPGAVHAAMDRLHPGGVATAAEKEYHGSELYWELSKEVDGLEVEAMFLPDGTLHSEEVEVAASTVPSAVAAAVAAELDGDVTKWEEIRDADRALVEYHAKVASSGRAYKVRVSLDGRVLAVVRELVAEIEVPVTRR